MNRKPLGCEVQGFSKNLLINQHMAYLNKIQLIGNVGKAPEVRTFDGSNKVANFTLATTTRYTDRNGQLVDATTWHNIQVNGKIADVAEKYVQKGDPIYVEGELTARTYVDRNNVERVIYEVRASQLQLLRQRGSAAQEIEDDLPC